VNLRNLDALRGLLAVYVLVGHSRWLLWAGHAEWLRAPHAGWEVPLAFGSAAFRYGHEAVMVFFVLSGFFIHLRAGGPLRAGLVPAPVPARKFFARRAHRLLAPYGLALLVTVTCDLAGRYWFPVLYAAQTGDALLDQSFARGGYAIEGVVPAMLLLPSSLGRDFGSNGALWSLAYEVIYYLLYPLWFSLRRRSGALAFGLVPALCVGLAWLPSVPFLPLVLIHYSVWLAGAFLAERMAGAQPSYRAAALSVVAVAVGFAWYLASRWSAASVVATILFGGAAVTAFALMPTRERPGWLLRAFEYLGVRSYTIYIVHLPFVALLAAGTIQTLGARPLHGWLAVAGVVLAIGFSCLCFELCERHFLHPRIRVRAAAA
jgi:peptidoglycan/LPS O-acetylase OafA/YrhL